MEWDDIAKIVFGAVIGLVISLAKDWFAELRDTRRAKKLLLLELPHIQTTVDGLSGKKIMPTTELPMLSDLGVRELMALPSAIAAPIRRLQQALWRAELSRKIAAGLLENQDSPQFKLHSTSYVSWLTSAKEALDDVRAILSTDSTQ